MSAINKKNYCSNCGNEIEQGQKFCGKCGMLVGKNAVQENKGKAKHILIGIVAVLLLAIFINGFKNIDANTIEEYNIEIKDDEKLIRTEKDYKNMQSGEKVVMVVSNLAHTTSGGCDWLAAFVNCENGKIGDAVGFAIDDKNIDFTGEEEWVISGIYKETQTINDGTNTDIALLEVYDYRLPWEAVGESGENKEEAEGIIDLYQYRMATEEALINDLNFEANEYNVYPSEDRFVFSCIDGMVYSITLTDNDIGMYSFLGVSVGDDYDAAKEKISNYYTFLVATENGNTLRNAYSDNEFGMLILDYDITTDRIESISYVAENAENEEYSVNDYEDGSQGYASYEDVLDITLSMYGEYNEYAVFDIDEDGIEELIISYGASDADWENDVFTIIEGDVTYIGTFYNVTRLYVADKSVTNDGKGIIAVSGNMGIENIDQITKVSNTLLVENVVYRELSDGEDYYGNELEIPMLNITDKSLLY